MNTSISHSKLHFTKAFFLAIGIAFTGVTFAQDLQPIVLYPQGVPNSKPAPADYVERVDDGRVSRVTNPALIPYFPEKSKATGTAIIICQGGGYAYQAGYEGEDVAKKFNEIGVTAFVLKYRLPNEKIMLDKSIGPLQDAQRAIQIVRQRAAEWGINPAKIGIVGFSAGGHLASTAGTHFDKPVIDAIDNISVRPDFMVLIYPVITMGELTHPGSRNNLLGAAPAQAKIDLFSNEKQVTANTPPTFIVHSSNDKHVPVKNSIMLYEALVKEGVKVEMHLYPTGVHGYAMNKAAIGDSWLDRCKNWLINERFLAAQ
jgi:acetyl esterase/lipase